MKFAPSLILVVLSLVAGPALAEPATAVQTLPLTWAQALDRGIANNLGLRADGLVLNQKQADDATSWNLFVPKVNLGANLIQSVKPEADLVGLRTMGQLSVDAEWSFNPALFNAVKQTKLEYQRGRLSGELARLRLTRDLRKAFSSLVLSRESLQILEDTRAQAQARLTQAQALLNAGSGTSLAVLVEEVNVAALALPLADQQDQEQAIQGGLRNLLGLAPGVVIEPVVEAPGSVPAVDAGRGPNGRLDLACLGTLVDTLENRVDGGRLALFPSVFVKLTVDPTYQRDVFRPGDTSGLSGSDLWKMNTGALVIGVTVPVDALVPGSGRMAELARYQADLEAGKLRYAAARDAAQTEIDTLVGELRRLVLRRQVGVKSIELADSLYRQMQKAFDTGSKTRLELQDALNKRNNARFEDAKDRFNEEAKRADLEYALAGGDLAAGNDRL